MGIAQRVDHSKKVDRSKMDHSKYIDYSKSGSLKEWTTQREDHSTSEYLKVCGTFQVAITQGENRKILLAIPQLCTEHPVSQG